jgi:hypothetical protein
MNFPQAEGAYKTAFDQSRKNLQTLKPYDILQGSNCSYDESASYFILDSFGRKIKVTYPYGIVTFLDTNTALPLDWALIILNYLSAAKPIQEANELVSYRELHLGDVFFPNIKTYVLTVLGEFYANCDKTTLLISLTKLGFVRVPSKADLAVRGRFAPKVPVTILFWEGEEEIPSSCQLLFDRTISQHMHIEDIAVLCGVIKYLIISQCNDAAKKRSPR